MFVQPQVNWFSLEWRAGAPRSLASIAPFSAQWENTAQFRNGCWDKQPLRVPYFLPVRRAMPKPAGEQMASLA